MCGIVGFIDKEKIKGRTIKNMTNRIAHRGPDGEGYYADEYIALGHRRLAIIDEKNGSQPMISEDKKLIIVYNGEIYNYKELREELIRKSYTFKTNSDTEVLLNSYKEWGYKVVEKLRGMFAFAIWDKENKTLYCARDNFGIKPFYYYKNEEVFMFSSEVKSFLEHPKFNKELNKELLGPYLSFSFTPTNETFFKGVYSLEPGCVMIVKDNEIKIKKYFEINFYEKQQDFNEAVNNISKAVTESINYHKIGDAEVGAFLSSGVDSSYIVSVAKPNKTYTIGYELGKYSEINYAKELTNSLGLENTSKKLDSKEYIKSIPKILYYMDEPICDPSAISLYFLAEMASKDIKVIMSGEGADEIFGGYNTYKTELDFKLYNKLPYPIRYILANVFSRLPEFKGRNFIIRRGRKLEDEYIGVSRMCSEREVNKIMSFENVIDNKLITANIFKEFKNKSDILKMQAIDMKFWLVRDILLKADKMTMANSIEARVPFIDKEVFEVSKSLPENYKISKTETKIAFRSSAKRVIPNKAYEKKKLGFPVPLREWMKEEDIYNDIKNTINQDFVKDFLNQKYVLRLLEEHKKGKKDNYKKIWAVYCFIKWYEVFFINT